MPETSVFASFTELGFNHWPDAPSHRAYLSHTHRHVFHVRVEVSVDYDREIDFHLLQEQARSRFIGLHGGLGPRQFGPQSCETLARRLGDQLADLYARPVTVSVSEDGECGATARCIPGAME